MTTERMRQRVHAAADRIEVPAFDAQPLVATPPRRRTPWVPVAVAASVGLAVGATAWLVTTGDEPGPVSTTEPTTPGALVVIALDHIEAEPSSYEPDSRPAEDGVSAAIRFGSDGEYDGDQVSLLVGRGDGPEWLGCGEFDDGCATIGTATGDVTLSWQELVPEEDPGIVYVSQQRDDGFAMVGYSGRSIIGDPREQTLPVTVEEMVDIVSDPAFGPTTTEEYAEAGERLDWEYRAGDRSPEDDGPLSTTGQALAAVVQEHFREQGLDDLIVSGREATFVEPGGEVSDGFGIEVVLDGGYTLHVNVFAGEGKPYLACQPTLTCWDFEGLVLAGRPGLAGAFRSDENATVHTWLEGPGIDPRGITDFGLGQTFGGEPEPAAELLADTVRLVNAPGIGLFTDQRWLDAGEQVTWFTVQGEGDPED